MEDGKVSAQLNGGLSKSSLVSADFFAL